MKKIVDWLLVMWVLFFRTMWSKLRHRGQLTDIKIDSKDKFNPDDTIEVNIVRLAKKVMARFNYTSDDYSVLFDSMRSPADCYLDYKMGLLNDDCDGFHAVLSHILTKNGIDNSLATYVSRPVDKSHTVLYFKYDNREFILDYTMLQSNMKLDRDKNNILDNYAFTKYNKKGHEVIISTLNKWSYKKNKWVRI